MSELIASLGSVTGLILGLLVGVVWLSAAPGSRRPRRGLAALLIVYLVATVHGISLWLPKAPRTPLADVGGLPRETRRA
jgi:uncharacterized membrane protein YczE